MLRLSNHIFAHKIMRVKHVYYRQSILPGQRWGRLKTNSTNVGGKTYRDTIWGGGAGGQGGDNFTCGAKYIVAYVVRGSAGRNCMEQHLRSLRACVMRGQKAWGGREVWGEERTMRTANGGRGCEWGKRERRGGIAMTKTAMRGGGTDQLGMKPWKYEWLSARFAVDVDTC